MIRLETEAILAVLSAPEEITLLLRSGAHLLENGFNPVQGRREAVATWLTQGSIDEVAEDSLRARTNELIAMGFAGFDALHLASAELMAADVFLTVDRLLLKRAAKLAARLDLRVADPIGFVQEVSGWTN
jgi:hypothetical protein